jgi:uncharacterized protein DUF2332
VSAAADRDDELVRLADWYTWFATSEATGRSPLYAELAAGVAEDRELLESLVQLPGEKRQPNLLFAAVRHVSGLPRSPADLHERYFAHQPQITEQILMRRTQTNEPARCATLLPLLAQLPQPLALLEVGASAGLCLLVDRYRYDYGRQQLAPSDGDSSSPELVCRANERTPLPDRLPEVVWRAGLDLNPVDVSNPDAVSWLEALVWPGEGRRLEVLHQALELARRDPPRVIGGDLRYDLEGLAAQAPADATLVVFHTAVLAYVSDVSERDAFGESVSSVGARWISNEGGSRPGASTSGVASTRTGPTGWS